MNELKNIFPDSQILTDSESCKHYGRDWTTYYDIKAQAVVFPKTTDEVVQLVRWANQNKMALVPSGGRTGLSGAACATNGEIIVSFEKMNQVLNFNSIEQTLTVEPGVITESIQKIAVEKGLFYPVDFAARGSSQIGGNIATNAGGIKVVKYGLTRDWVIGLKVVTGTGEILELNNSLVKNATGYDLRHLLIGSEGTLGFITEATIQLAPKPPPLQVFILALPNLESVMKVFAAFKSSTQLVAYELLSDLALKHVLSSTGLPNPFQNLSPFYAVVEFENRMDNDLEKAMETFEMALEQGWILDGQLSQSSQQAQQFWRYREDISESLSKFSPYKNDIAVAISLVPEFMHELDVLLKTAYPTWEVVWFGHIGDGNLHINILRPTQMSKEDFVNECRKVDLLVFKTVEKFKGSISAEHGVGLSKKDFLNYTRSNAEIEIMKSIKKAFDPNGILNPGKIF
jgi:glycolate oxidase subunit GlcD